MNNLCNCCDCDCEIRDTEYSCTLPKDNVYRPSHYGSFTPLDAFSSGLLSETELKGFMKGSAIKYICRYEAKNGVEDLQKAQEFLRLLTKLENGENIIGE